MHESRWLVKLSTCQLAVSSVLCPHGRATMLPPDAACIIQCTRKATTKDSLPKSTLLHSQQLVFSLSYSASYIFLGKTRRNALIALKTKDFFKKVEEIMIFSYLPCTIVLTQYLSVDMYSKWKYKL